MRRTHVKPHDLASHALDHSPPRKNFAADGGRALRARQAMDMWTMRLRRTGCARGQRAAARPALPHRRQPSTTCPQPSTIEMKSETEERNDNKQAGNIPS